MAARQVLFPQALRDAPLHACQDAPLNVAQNVPLNAAQGDGQNPAQADGQNAPQNVRQALQVQQAGRGVLQAAPQNADAQNGEPEVNILVSICRQDLNLIWARFSRRFSFPRTCLFFSHFL